MDIHSLNAQINKLNVARDKKVPLQDKIPKESVFYKHLISSTYNLKVQDAGSLLCKQDLQLMREVRSQTYLS